MKPGAPTAQEALSEAISELFKAAAAGDKQACIDLLRNPALAENHHIQLAAGAGTLEGTFLHVAAHTGHDECANFFLQQASDANQRKEMLFAGADDCSTPLHYAAHAGHEGCVGALLDGASNAEERHEMLHARNLEDTGRQTPLHLAAQSGHGACVGVLLQQAALAGCLHDVLLAPAGTEMFEATPLHVAADQGHKGCVAALLDWQTNADVRSAAFDAKKAVDSGQSGTQEWRAVLTATTSFGNTPFHLAARHSSSSCLLEFLRGAPGPADRQEMLETANHFGNLPWHQAAVAGSAECGRVLLKTTDSSQECVCLLFATNKSGNTALHLAAKGGHEEFIKMLLFEFASTDALVTMPNSSGNLPLHEAAKGGSAECGLVLLTSTGSLQERSHFLIAANKSGDTALHLAAKGGHTEFAKMLCEFAVSARALVTIPNNSGNLPLHEATRGGAAECGRFLLTSVASSQECIRLLVAANKSGDTALHLAAKDGHEEFAKMFLLECAVSADTLTTLLKAKNTKEEAATDIAKHDPLQQMSAEAEEASQKKGTQSLNEMELLAAEEDVTGFAPLGSNGLTSKDDIDEARVAVENAMRRSVVGAELGSKDGGALDAPTVTKEGNTTSGGASLPAEADGLQLALSKIDSNDEDQVKDEAAEATVSWADPKDEEQAEKGGSELGSKGGGAPKSPTVAQQENTSSSRGFLPTEANGLRLTLSNIDRNAEDEVEDEAGEIVRTSLHGNVKEEDGSCGETMSDEGSAASSTREPVLQRPQKWNGPSGEIARQETSEVVGQLQAVRRAGAEASGSGEVVGRSHASVQEEGVLLRAQLRAVEEQRDEALALVASLEAQMQEMQKIENDKVHLLEDRVKVAELEEREMREKSRVLQEENEVLQEEREALSARVKWLEEQSQQVTPEIGEDSAAASSAEEAGATAARPRSEVASSKAMQPLADQREPLAPGPQTAPGEECNIDIARCASASPPTASGMHKVQECLERHGISVGDPVARDVKGLLEKLGASTLDELLYSGDEEDLETVEREAQLKKFERQHLRAAVARARAAASALAAGLAEKDIVVDQGRAAAAAAVLEALGVSSLEELLRAGDEEDLKLFMEVLQLKKHQRSKWMVLSSALRC